MDERKKKTWIDEVTVSVTGSGSQNSGEGKFQGFIKEMFRELRGTEQE